MSTRAFDSAEPAPAVVHAPDDRERPFATWIDVTAPPLAHVSAPCTCGDDRCVWVASAQLEYYRASDRTI